MSNDKEKMLGMIQPKINRTMKMMDGYNDRPRALTQEERLRKENPGLQELYDQYQTMLKLLMPAKSKQGPDVPIPKGPIKRKMVR